MARLAKVKVATDELERQTKGTLRNEVNFERASLYPPRSDFRTEPIIFRLKLLHKNVDMNEFTLNFCARPQK